MIKEIPTYKLVEFSEKKSDYCVAIPILNESERISNELIKMREQKISEIADIIILDGGSTDGSTNSELLKDLQVRSLLTMKSLGKQGTQFRMGFHYILNQGYKGIVTIDGNDKDGVETIPNFINELENGIDFIQGSRFLEGGIHKNTPIYRLLAVRLIHAPWLSFLSGFKYTDTTNGFRGISMHVIKDTRLNLFRNIFVGYELLFYMSARIPKLGFKVKEIPVSRIYPYKSKVPTKINFFTNILIIKELILISMGKYD